MAKRPRAKALDGSRVSNTLVVVAGMLVDGESPHIYTAPYESSSGPGGRYRELQKIGQGAFGEVRYNPDNSGGTIMHQLDTS